MGTVGFYRGFTNKTGEIGYVLNEAFRGQGFMEEALKSAIYYGFSQLELETIIAYTDGDNHSSIRVLLKTGFTEIVSDNPEYRKWIKYK